MSNEKLEKKWKEALLGLSLATASPATAPTMTPQPEKQITFDPKSLHRDLHPIAHMESSFGQNMKHKVSSKGELDTAVGALGLKPTTAHEEYLRSPALQKLHPNLKEVKALLNEMKSNPQFYNNVAATHWNRLKKLTGSPEKAAFAWRYGPTAASKTPDAAILKDKYVQGYIKHANPEVQKSEDLMKKGIDSLRPGTPTWRDKNKNMMGGGGGYKVFNYDHLLSPQHIAKGYSLTAHDNGHNLEVTAHHNGKVVGNVDGHRAPVLKDKLQVSSALVQPEHRGQGLGTAAYEALYTHAKHKGGITTVSGGVHSTMARHVHQKMAEKHGLAYHAKPEIGNELARPTYPNMNAWKQAPIGEYDNKFGPYEMKLSEENLGKAIGDIKPGTQMAGTEHPTFDYSHILRPEHRAAGYTMHIEHTPTINAISGLPVPGLKPSPTVTINHPNAPLGAGILEASHRGNAIEPSVADIPDEHQGQGLGQAMYEALYAHGKHVLGATEARGDAHSTMASRVHQKLSVKHGLGYMAQPNKAKSNVANSQLSSLTPKQQSKGAYDAKFAPYSYALKYDDFAKELEDWNKKD